MNKHRATFLIICAISLLLPLIVVQRLCDYANWSTGAHRVQWVYGDGTPIDPDPDALTRWEGCRPNDIGLNTFRHDNALWTLCNDPSYSGNIGFAHVDPAKGLGTVWRFPKDLPHVFTNGLAVGPDQEVAIVYTTPALHGDLALGIINKDQGWIFGPKKIPNSKDARLSVVSWVSGELTLIYYNTTSYWPWIVTVDGQTMDAGKFKKPQMIDDSVYFDICKFFFSDQAWHAVISSRDFKRNYVIKEDGTWVTEDFEDCFGLQSDLELAALGITYISNDTALRHEDASEQAINGKTKLLQPPPVNTWEAVYTYSWLDGISGGGLIRSPLWDVSSESFDLARPFGDGWLVLDSSESNPNNDLVAHVLDSKGEERLTRAIARTPCFNCGNLTIGVPIFHKEGFWLVSQDGCFISVGDDLSRLDPLPVLEHLRARGSLNPEWNEWSHIVAFFWIFLGLPICLAIGFIIAKIRHNQLYSVLFWGGAVYLISGTWALNRIFPLLR